MQYTLRPEDSVEYPGTGVTRNCEPCSVGAGYQTLGLSARAVLLTPEPSIQPHHLP